MPEEMNDYSGPFNPDLTFADFSKDFLLKLINVWQYAWLHMTEAWYNAVKKRFGVDAANHCENEAWVAVGEKVNPRYAKVANIQLNTIIDSLKAVQLPLDNLAGGLNIGEYEIKSPYHVILTMKKCRTLEFLEAKEPERMQWVCPKEKEIFEKYLINPKIKVTPLLLPPRKSPDAICCQWEYKMEE